MLGSANAQLGSAILGFGAAQGMLLGSSWNPSALWVFSLPHTFMPLAINQCQYNCICTCCMPICRLLDMLHSFTQFKMLGLQGAA